MRPYFLTLVVMTALGSGCFKTTHSSNDDEWDDSWDDSWGDENTGEAEGGSAHHDHDHEAITKVILDITSQADGSEQTINFTDPQTGDGGVDADIELVDGTTYTMAMTILNDVEDPIEDITLEILDEQNDHQVFFTGSAITNGIVTFTYEDEDDNGLPLGLDTTITGATAGEGIMTLTLQHMAEQNGNPVKRAGMAADVAADGLDGISGEGAPDFTIDFPVNVE